MPNYTLTTAATTEPVTLADVLEHLRIDSRLENSYVADLIKAARHYVEQYTYRSLITQSWTATFDDFLALPLRFGDVSSLTSLTYVDTDGVTQTLSTSIYELARENGRQIVRMQYNQVWPARRVHPDNITVVYVAGYGAAAAVPQAIKQAMLMLIGHWFENRETVNIGTTTSELSFTVDALLAPYRFIEV